MINVRKDRLNRNIREQVTFQLLEARKLISNIYELCNWDDDPFLDALHAIDRLRDIVYLEIEENQDKGGN